MPVVDHPVLVDEARTIPRSAVADVYALIIADLQFAIANLPANYNATAAQYPLYSATDVGRATKYAAEATLAKVYMTRSGPTYGIEGPGMGTPDAVSERLQDAREFRHGRAGTRTRQDFPHQRNRGDMRCYGNLWVIPK